MAAVASPFMTAKMLTRAAGTAAAAHRVLRLRRVRVIAHLLEAGVARAGGRAAEVGAGPPLPPPSPRRPARARSVRAPSRTATPRT
jgi:hypothetical protein